MARGDLKSPTAIYFKGFSFVFICMAASALLLVEHFSWRHLFLLLVSIWAACRSYYFAFYVIQNFVDEDYKFAGIWDFARYMIGKAR